MRQRADAPDLSWNNIAIPIMAEAVADARICVMGFSYLR